MCMPLLQSLAPQIFAISIVPYIGFLYHLTKSGKFPKTTTVGFYFLLAFVGATIPAGIYGKGTCGCEGKPGRGRTSCKHARTTCSKEDVRGSAGKCRLAPWVRREPANDHQSTGW